MTKLSKSINQQQKLKNTENIYLGNLSLFFFFPPFLKHLFGFLMAGNPETGDLPEAHFVTALLEGMC